MKYIHCQQLKFLVHDQYTKDEKKSSTASQNTAQWPNELEPAFSSQRVGFRGAFESSRAAHELQALDKREAMPASR